jgi:hypothetical protein
MHSEVYGSCNSGGWVSRDYAKLDKRGGAGRGCQKTTFGINAHIRKRLRIGAPSYRVRDVDLLSAGCAGGHKLFATAIGDAGEAVLGGNCDGGQVPDDNGDRSTSGNRLRCAFNDTLPWANSCE